MKLTLEFIYTKLMIDGLNPKRRFASKTEPWLMCVGVLGSGLDPKVEILYIDIAEAPAAPMSLRVPDDHRVSLITTCSREALFKDCELVLLPDGTNMVSLMQDLSMLFIELNSWSDSVSRALASGASLQTIVNLTVPIVGNPLYFCDTSFQQIAVWGGEMGYTSPIWKYQLKYHYLPYTVMQSLIDTGDLTRIFNSTKAWIVRDSEAFVTPFVSKALYNDGKHLGNLFFIQYYKKLNYCDIEIAEYLGTLVAQAVSGDRAYVEASPLYNSHFIEELIAGKKIDDQILTDYLKALRWKENDAYLVAQVEAVQEREAIKHHIMALISTQLDAQCLEHDENVLAIVNIHNGTSEAAIKSLESIIRSFNCNLAISEEFDDFALVGRFHRQTSVALGMMGEDDRAQAIRYSSVFLNDVDQILKEYLPVSKHVLKLVDHDKKHGTSLCDTLLTWLLNDRNSSKTADSMFVHRNTLLKRLARVEDVMGIELDDFDDYQFKIRTMLSLISTERSRRTEGKQPPK